MTVKPEHLGGDRWRVRVYIGPDPMTGRPRQLSRYFRAPNARTASKLAPGLEGELRAEGEQRKERAGTVDGLVDEWLRFRDAQDSPNTIRGRKAIIRRIRQGLGKVPLDDLSARHVDQWMTDLRADGLRPTTIANHHTALRAILNQGDAWDMVTATPTRKARAPARQRRKPTPPTAAAVTVLIDSAAPDLAMCAELAAQAGMRESEVVGLRWSDVDFGNFVIHVNRALVRVDEAGKGRWEAVTKLPKSNQPRTVPVSRALLALLADHLHRQIDFAGTTGAADFRRDENGWVIADLVKDPAGGVPRKPQWLARAWERHRKRQGSTATFHDLRHWHATELIDAGVPLPVVQQRLGHLQLTTTANVYSHSVGESERHAAEVISSRRGGEKGIGGGAGGGASTPAAAVPAGKESP